MIRQLAVELLIDENGISSESYELLWELLQKEGGCEDIIQSVEATDGRFYLPETWEE